MPKDVQLVRHIRGDVYYGDKKKTKEHTNVMEKNITGIKKIILFWQTSHGVCCYILIGYNKCSVHLTVDSCCHENMTSKRGENVTR